MEHANDASQAPALINGTKILELGDQMWIVDPLNTFQLNSMAVSKIHHIITNLSSYWPCLSFLVYESDIYTKTKNK